MLKNSLKSVSLVKLKKKKKRKRQNKKNLTQPHFYTTLATDNSD